LTFSTTCIHSASAFTLIKSKSSAKH
jgi:hypothetical protein